MNEQIEKMLALVAKAAGYIIHSDAWACWAGGAKPRLFHGNSGPEWNPLNDDGDIFRIMLDAGISLKLTQVAAIATHPSGVRFRFRYRDSPREAARSAVLRAAAALGEKAT
jgi:hypothetical protein